MHQMERSTSVSAYIVKEPPHVGLVPEVGDGGRHGDDVVRAAQPLPILVRHVEHAAPSTRIAVLHG